jgi:hypothetical protein
VVVVVVVLVVVVVVSVLSSIHPSFLGIIFRLTPGCQVGSPFPFNTDTDRLNLMYPSLAVTRPHHSVFVSPLYEIMQGFYI